MPPRIPPTENLAYFSEDNFQTVVCEKYLSDITDLVFDLALLNASRTRLIKIDKCRWHANCFNLGGTMNRLIHRL